MNIIKLNVTPGKKQTNGIAEIKRWSFLLYADSIVTKIEFIENERIVLLIFNRISRGIVFLLIVFPS